MSIINVLNKQGQTSITIDRKHSKTLLEFDHVLTPDELDFHLLHDDVSNTISNYTNYLEGNESL